MYRDWDMGPSAPHERRTKRVKTKSPLWLISALQPLALFYVSKLIVDSIVTILSRHQPVPARLWWLVGMREFKPPSFCCKNVPRAMSPLLRRTHAGLREDRQRSERLETWPNILLDPKAKAALGDLSPVLVWSQVGNLVAHTFEAYPDEAGKLLDKYQPPVNQEWLYLALQHLDPVVGIKNLVEINDHPKLNLKDLMKSNPPDVLEKVLFMVTLSSKWQSEVAT